MHHVLSWVKREQRTVSLLTSEETYTGRVKALDDLRVTVEAFDFFGRPTGQPTALPLRDVESLTIGTEEESMYDLLNASADKTEHLYSWRDNQPT
jgi:hypothetical protein